LRNLSKTKRAWVRVAFESEDKGRVFGRGGRNIEAIRTVIAAAAAGHSVYLDIYGSQVQAENMSGLEEDGRAAPTRERRPTDPKLVAKPLRFQFQLNKAGKHFLFWVKISR